MAEATLHPLQRSSPKLCGSPAKQPPSLSHIFTYGDWGPPEVSFPFHSEKVGTLGVRGEDCYAGGEENRVALLTLGVAYPSLTFARTPFI